MGLPVALCRDWAAGNICEPNLGLSSDEGVDTVIHAAACVNHLKSYAELFDAK